MSRIDAIAVASLASLVFGWSPAAQSAGDAARGSTLYHTTYSCISCHTASPQPGDVIAPGATVDGLTTAIQNVGEMARFLSTLGQNQTDLADIAAYIASVTSTGPASLDLDQQGLTGSWYEAVTSGQGFELEVYPDLSGAGTGLGQMSWFTFDTVVGGAERQRWYTLSGPVVSGKPNASLTIYQNTGGNFNVPPVTTAHAVGTATLSFDTCTTGRLSYNFTDGSGRTGAIPLTRITQNMTCSSTSARPTNADFALSGNWYVAATSGQGFTIEVNPNSNVLFFAWYTYAPGGAGVGAAGQRWYTGQAAFAAGARSIPLQIYETTGGMFNAPTNPAAKTLAVGSGTLAFQSCTSATLTFNFTAGSSSGMSGAINLSRIGPVPQGCV